MPTNSSSMRCLHQPLAADFHSAVSIHRAVSKRVPGTTAAAMFAMLVLLLAWPAFGQTAADSYRLGPGDRISFTVAEAPELGSAFSEIRDDGTIVLPGENMGVVRLTGLTLEQAETAIQSRLERVLKQATVRAILDQARGSSVRLLGAVTPQGPQPINQGTTLFELLAGAQIGDSNAGTVQLRRTSSQGLVDQVELPLGELLQGLEPRYLLPLQDGDLITIPAGEPITVYFVGEVASTVKFSADEPKTLIRAIAKVGGLTERSSNKILITRSLPDGSQRIFEAHYKRILNGKDDDVALEQGDLVHIKRSII